MADPHPTTSPNARPDFGRELDPDAAAEPLELWVRAIAPPDSLADLRCVRLEFSSRGDRVAARLLLPTHVEAPFPLILLQHGAGGAKDADYLDFTAGPWVRGGAAVASIDFPLHGERYSAKLTSRLLDGLAADRKRSLVPEPRLWTEFVSQAVHDLQRALDSLSGLPEIDSTRIAYASFSLGTIIGGTFLGIDPRPRAAALAIGGGGFGPKQVDPVEHIGRFAPRPLLMVNATRDERIPRRSTEALFAAAGEPKRLEWFEASHQGLPGRALKSMWIFLKENLDL